MSRPTKVVMIGGGYATVHAYRALTRRWGGAVEITVVSADDCHNFHGFTGEVVAGLLPHEITRTPLIDVLRRATFVHGTVVRVDLTARMVSVEPATGTAPQQIPYDELVVASGGREPLDAIPGMAEHGFTLRAPGEFARWLTRLAVATQVATPTSLSNQPTSRGVGEGEPAMVIAGGGMAGVELAAAVADRLRASGTRRTVVVVHSGATTMSDLRADRPRVAARADRELARLGVTVRTGLRIVAVDDDGVALSDGSFLRAAAVLATTGQRPTVLPGLESLPHDHLGRLVTDANLRVAPGIWAAGDTARVAHPGTGKPVAANALWAIKAGGQLGRNLSRVIEGRRPLPFGYRGLGQAMGFGIGRAAAELYGIPINGVPGWILRLAFFLRFMPSRRRAVAVVGAMLALPVRGRYGLMLEPSLSMQPTSHVGAAATVSWG